MGLSSGREVGWKETETGIIFRTTITVLTTLVLLCGLPGPISLGEAVDVRRATSPGGTMVPTCVLGPGVGRGVFTLPPGLRDASTRLPLCDI